MDASSDDPATRVAALFDAHHQRLFRLARRLVRDPDDPADLVQETFLRAARAPSRVPHGAAHEEAWLVRVLIIVCKDSWRHTAVRVKGLAEGHVRVAGAANPASGMLVHAMVWRALDRLPPRRRAILVLYELEGLPVAEIAALIGITPVTVRWHLMRAPDCAADGDQRSDEDLLEIRRSGEATIGGWRRVHPLENQLLPLPRTPQRPAASWRSWRSSTPTRTPS